MPPIPMSFHVQQAAKRLQEKLDGLDQFLRELPDQDRRNFIALLDLPNPNALINRCPDPKYKDMFILALELKKLPLKDQRLPPGAVDPDQLTDDIPY